MLQKKRSQIGVPWLLQMRYHEDAVTWRRLILGGNLDEEQNLTLIRLPFEGATKDNNVCLVLHQSDDVNSPAVLKLKNSGMGNLIETSTGARLSANGIWSDAPLPVIQMLSSEQILKTLGRLDVYICGTDAERYYMPRPDEFTKETGTGDGKLLTPISIASFALKAVRCLFDVLNRFIVATDQRLERLEKASSASSASQSVVGRKEKQ